MEPFANLLTWPTRVSRSSIVVHAVAEGEPLSKQRPRVVAAHGTTRAYTPKQTKDAEDGLRWWIASQNRILFPDADHSFGVRLLFVQGNYHRRDLDNMAKLVFDACTGYVWKDDSQVTEIHARKAVDSKRPCSEIVVYTMGTI